MQFKKLAVLTLAGAMMLGSATTVKAGDAFEKIYDRVSDMKKGNEFAVCVKKVPAARPFAEDLTGLHESLYKKHGTTLAGIVKKTPPAVKAQFNNLAKSYNEKVKAETGCSV